MDESLKEDENSEISESEVCEGEADQLGKHDFIVTSDIMDSPCKKYLDSSQNGKNNEVSQESGLLNQIFARLTDIEKRVDKIIFNAGPNDGNNVNLSRHTIWGASTENNINFKVFFDRISMLERETLELINENMALKIEKSNMKVMTFKENEVPYNQNGNKRSNDFDRLNDDPNIASRLENLLHARNN